jgi:ferredoxin-NADP reductase
MAPPRTATVRAIELFPDHLGRDDVRAITFAPPADAPLGFAGGQFIIVDTGQVAASGKAIKRAYSILSADTDQSQFVLATKRLPRGPGSTYMHGLTVGDVITFSGPWGKLMPPPEAGGQPHGRTLVLATDTGITAALGLVQSQRFAPLRAKARFVWLRTDPGYFLPDAFVRARLPADLGQCQLDVVPPVHHPERLPHVMALVGPDLAPGRVQQVFITGDGDVNYALLDHFTRAGVGATRDNVESFFNAPKKSDALPAVNATATPAAKASAS